MESHTVRGGEDVTLRVDETGEGRPILLLHGYSQSRLCWRKQLRSDLAEDFRLVAMDLRGHGDSEKPHDAYGDGDLWAADVRAVVEELELDDAILVGWSYAGLVVLDYLARYGTDRVAGVNFAGIVSSIGTETGTARLDQRYLDLLSGFVATDTDESVAAMSDFVRLCVHDELPPEEFYFMLGYNLTAPPRVREALRDRTVDHEAVLAELDVPVLLTHGEADAVVKPSAVDEAAELCSDVTVSMYPETGHTPFWEDPDRYERDLRAFAADL